MEFLIAALTIGFVGSLHCIGMCGPIALALPVYGQGVFNRIAGPLLYNTGRIITYGFLGMLFGLLGKGFVIGGYQQLLSIILGILILASMLLPASIKSRLGMTKIIAPFIAKIKSLLGRFLKQRTAGSFLIIGLLNGLLPCGLVYLAIAGAIATGDVINSGAFMMAFGIGTIPAL
ncbi:MAG TPA: sulfite exporter TauE/SafE family protein, partial [Chitinophagales bacterium]|nr:sulfite exporter TauE/SafE family protein [Chitinophagales bacterium]